MVLLDLDTLVEERGGETFVVLLVGTLVEGRSFVVHVVRVVYRVRYKGWSSAFSTR